MIGRLRGTLVTKRAESACVEVGGVGYEVALTPRSLGALPGIGEEVVIHTHTHVREDEMSLFGFDTEPFDMTLPPAVYPVPETSLVMLEKNSCASWSGV